VSSTILPCLVTGHNLLLNIVTNTVEHRSVLPVVGTYQSIRSQVLDEGISSLVTPQRYCLLSDSIM
jgi:hypothetical protein